MATAKEQNIIIQAYKNVFSGEDGKRVLNDLEKHFSISAFGLPRNTAIDPFRTHVDVGKMQVFGYIKHQFDRELLQENENE